MGRGQRAEAALEGRNRNGRGLRIGADVNALRQTHDDLAPLLRKGEWTASPEADGALRDLRSARDLCDSRRPGDWELAEALTDDALTQLGPLLAERGKGDPALGRFLTIVDRYAFRRGRQQLEFLSDNGCLSSDEAVLVKAEIRPLYRQAFLSPDGSAAGQALLLMEQSGRAGRLLRESGKLTPLRQRALAYADQVADVATDYFRERLEARQQGQGSERDQEREHWLRTQGRARARLSLAVARGLLDRRLESKRRGVEALMPAHAQALARALGQEPQAPLLLVSDARWLPSHGQRCDEGLYESDLGIILSEQAADEALASDEENKLSQRLLHEMIHSTQESPQQSDEPLAQVERGIQEGVTEALACLVMRTYGNHSEAQPQSYQAWCVLVEEAIASIDPRAMGPALVRLAQTPPAQLGSTLARGLARDQEESLDRRTLATLWYYGAGAGRPQPENWSQFRSEVAQAWRQLIAGEDAVSETGI